MEAMNTALVASEETISSLRAEVAFHTEHVSKKEKECDQYK